MKVSISSIGSRGEVQPIIALALKLRGLGHEAVLRVPPNFKAWIESFRLTCIPVGPDVQKFASSLKDAKAKSRKPSKAQLRKIIGYTARLAAPPLVPAGSRSCPSMKTEKNLRFSSGGARPTA